MEKKYYPINEELARQAHDMMSMSDYLVNSKTLAYQGYVDDAYQIADEAAAQRPEEAEHIYALADCYARKLAENMNDCSRIGTMCPSILITGGSNFPVKKKERQNAAADRNYSEYIEIQKILDKIRSIARGKDIIHADDENAVEKLEKKLESLKKQQEFMKGVNLYYRKHGTLEGCDLLSDDLAHKLDEEMVKDWRSEKKPFLSWQLSNNNKNIHSVEARIAKLKNLKGQQTTQREYDGFHVVEETAIMRLQIFFDDKPDSQIRDLLKKNGFRWAPSQSAWQRQLTDNARSVFKRCVLPELQKLAQEES